MFVFLCNSYGQKIRYKDIKDKSSTNNYQQRIENQKYSPTIAGICNYLIPSSGYFYIGEPIRGTCILGAELVTCSVTVTGLVMSMSVNSDTGQSPVGARAVMLSGIIATGLIQIWSIYDVIKVTTIKNLAYQEAKISVTLKPDVFIDNQDNKNLTTYGLRLSFNF